MQKYKIHSYKCHGRRLAPDVIDVIVFACVLAIFGVVQMPLLVEGSDFAGEDGWSLLRLSDSTCNVEDGSTGANRGSALRCHAGGYLASKLMGRFNRYHLRVNMSSGAGGGEVRTGRFNLGLHSRRPGSESLLIKMLNSTAQRCTDHQYCTLQTWWEKFSPRVEFVRDVARMQYLLTPVGPPIPLYDMAFNESIDWTQMRATDFWNQTVSQAFPGYTSVADLLDCDTDFVMQPFLQPNKNPYECLELGNSSYPANITTVPPFTATAVLPIKCARLPLPQTLLTDLLSDVGAHELRTAYDLLKQFETDGTLPGTVGFLQPFTQLTQQWTKYGDVWQYLKSRHLRHYALASPPCSSRLDPNSILLSHYYKIGSACQLYQVAPRPSWILRLNVTMYFDRDQVHPAVAQLARGAPTLATEVEVQMSWWIIWDGDSVTVHPEADYSQRPVANIVQRFLSVSIGRVVQMDDSKHRRAGPSSRPGYVMACGSQLDSAQGIAQNPWEQTPWMSKPDKGWYFPVPSPGFLRTGWTDNQWNDSPQAAALAGYRPGPFYWVDPSAVLQYFGAECGKVGAVGPCTGGSSSIDNPYGPLYAFRALNEYSRNLTQYNGQPFSSLSYRSPYLPPLDPQWGNDLKPRAWLAAHTDANIPLSLMVEPAADLTTELALEAVIHMSERLANPRQFPLHRISSGNSTTTLPLRNIYQQTLNTSLSSCLIQWYNLTHAYAQDKGNLSRFLEDVKLPPPGQPIGSIHPHFCFPPDYNLPPSSRQPKSYIQTWTCESSQDFPFNQNGSMPAPPFVFRQFSDADSLAYTANWDSPTRCNASQPRIIYPSEANGTALQEWFTGVARAAYTSGAVRFPVARCRVQLTDPEAHPNIALFRDAAPLKMSRLPARFQETVLPTLETTVLCFIDVAIDTGKLVAGIPPDTFQQYQQALAKGENLLDGCNPVHEDCGLANSYETIVWVMGGGLVVLSIIVLILIIYIAARECARKRDAAKLTPPPPGTGPI